MLRGFLRTECIIRFLKVGNQFCSRWGKYVTPSDNLTVRRQGYSWGVLWELVRIHRLNSHVGITPRVCRNLIGKNAAIGPHVKAIVLEKKLEGDYVSDLGKAERDARVSEFRLRSGFSKLTDFSLHGNTLILRSHFSKILPPVFCIMVAGWSLWSGSQTLWGSNSSLPSSVLPQDLGGDLGQRRS